MYICKLVFCSCPYEKNDGVLHTMLTAVSSFVRLPGTITGIGSE